MLELRDQGRTIFFSSHILSDAEALCSQVAIVAKGRLAAAGRLTDLQEFAIQGWELVMAGVPAGGARARPRRARAASMTIAGDRYVIELPPDGRPEEMLRELTAAGRHAHLAQPAARDARRRLRAARRRDGRRARGPAKRMNAIRSSPVAVFRESVRDRVFYNLVLFAVLLVGRLDPDRPADRRPGREDHQGPRPRGDVALRPLHRRSSSASTSSRRKSSAGACIRCSRSRSAAPSSSSASTPACC